MTRAITPLKLPDSSEAILVEAARSVEPQAVRRPADRIRDRMEQDAADEWEEPVAEPADVLHVRDLPGGRIEFWGELSAETGARFTAMLEPLAQPRPDGPQDRALRWGEAFGDLVSPASRSTHLPSEAGERPHISVTLDFETLRRGVGHAVLDGGHYLSAARRAGSPATPRSSRWCWAPAPRCWTSGGRNERSAWRSARHCTRGTGGARSRAVVGRPSGATRTTSSTGPTAATPTSTTWCCCAAPTTA
ncbi:13E12 repeat family protein [Saccharothrix sp. NEAU-S10]|nr:DUF222 domain-containing protein [Saccharothrix luteola]MCC8250279.1 13E12 repeat family protein [Saccharothrix luteola]